MTPREHRQEYTKTMRLPRSPPLKRRHRRLLLGGLGTLVGLQLVMLAWLWTRPLPDRLERTGQGQAEALGTH
jgi:hypothetical protein